MAIIRSKATSKKKRSTIKPVSDEAMEQLARIMNDSPTLVKLHGTEWEIRGMKMGVQWLVAEEACKVVMNENASMGDVLKNFASNIGSVCRVITLALLNDKERIYGEDYQKVYDTLMWGDYDAKDWMVLLFEILSLINVDFFFESISVLKTVRETTLSRKMTKAEAES